MSLIIGKLFSEETKAAIDTAIATYKAGIGSELASAQRAMVTSDFIEAPDASRTFRGQWRTSMCLFHAGESVPTEKTADLQHITVTEQGTIAEIQATIDEALADVEHSSASDIDTTVAGTITTSSSLFESEDVGRKFKIGTVTKIITAYSDANNVDYDDAVEGAFASAIGQTGYLLGAEVIQDARMAMTKVRGSEHRMVMVMACEGESHVAGLGTSRTLWVSKSRGTTEGSGAVVSPFLTVQAAIDYAETNLTPVYNDPVLILIEAEIYDENLVIKKDGLHLQGFGGQGVTNIRASSGASLIVTNATTVSLATFLASGGHADPMTHYGDLVADSYHPWDNQLRDISFGTPAGSGYDVMFLGVGNGTSFMGNEDNAMRVTTWADFFARCANYVALQDDTWIAGTVRAHNVAGVWANRSQLGGYHGSYDVANDQPSDSGNYGLSGAASLLYGNLKLEGTARAGFDRLDALQLSGNADLDNTSSLRMEGGLVGGNINAEGGASFRGRGVHIQGSLTFASGAGTAQLDGGKYMGALTDPDVKFVRNIGN